MYFSIEKDFIHEGIRCIVIAHEMGHRCGYCEVPKDHPFSHQYYDNVDVDVHGGLTYAGEGHPIDNKAWWIGFDCGHGEDKRDSSIASKKYKDFIDTYNNLEWPDGFAVTLKTTEFVEEECKKLAEQINERTKRQDLVEENI